MLPPTHHQHPEAVTPHVSEQWPQPLYRSSRPVSTTGTLPSLPLVNTYAFKRCGLAPEGDLWDGGQERGGDLLTSAVGDAH